MNMEKLQSKWKKDGATKRPIQDLPKGLPDYGTGRGIWTAWNAGSPDEGRSFSILTTGQ
jgi:hypothetical protein